MSNDAPAPGKVRIGESTIALSGNFLARGRGVPTGHGWSWITAAWDIVRRALGMWIGIAVVLAVIFLMLAILPKLGTLASFVLSPVFAGGLAMVSRAVDTDGAARFSLLFGGFEHRVGTLVGIGFLYLLGTFAIFFIASVITGVGLFGLIASGSSPEAILAAGAMVALTLLIGLALMVPLVMAIWFAPALVVFHELGALEAMKASFAGSLKNVLPFLLYGVVLLFAAIVASMPALLGWLILGPIIAASVYTAYRDIYFSP